MYKKNTQKNTQKKSELGLDSPADFQVFLGLWDGLSVVSGVFYKVTNGYDHFFSGQNQLVCSQDHLCGGWNNFYSGCDDFFMWPRSPFLSCWDNFFFKVAVITYSVAKITFIVA